VRECAFWNAILDLDHKINVVDYHAMELFKRLTKKLCDLVKKELTLNVNIFFVDLCSEEW